MSLLLRFSSSKVKDTKEGGNSEIVFQLSMIDTNSIDNTLTEATSCSGGKESGPHLKRWPSQVRTSHPTYQRPHIAV